MKKVLLVAGAILLMATVAFAGVDLKNEDSKSYDIKVHEGATTTSTSISGSTTAMSRCSGDCKIEIVGGNTIEAKDGETVVIKDGKLSINN